MLLLRLALGGIFLVAGVLKAWSPIAFYEDIESYSLLPYPLTVATAFGLPFLEMVCGLCLIFGKALRAASAIITVLMGVFLIAVLQAWFRGLDIRCGCFGNSELASNYAWLLIRDAVLLLVAAWVWIRAKTVTA